MSPAEALRGLSAVSVDPGLAHAVAHGKVLDARVLGVSGTGPWPVIDRDGVLLAVYQPHGDGRAKPAVVVPAEAS